MTARVIDRNHYMTIERNPLIREGVFPYSGQMIGADDPNKIYNVYRPREELEKKEFLDSLKLLPFIDEHAMLGDPDEGLEDAEKKGTHGTTGEKIESIDGVVFSNLKIFSKSLRNMIETVKKELSLGYRAVYEKMPGVFNGQPYDYIQRNLIGNHLALVHVGRNNVAVLDHLTFDHFDVMDAQPEESKMADENTQGESEKKLSIDDLIAFFEENMPKIKALIAATAVEEAKKEEEKAEEVVEETVLDEDDKDEKKTEDESDDKKEKDSMDSAAEIKALRARIAKLEGADIVKDAVTDIAKRNRIANELSNHIGTFDHSEMTSAQVLKYGVEKLGLKVAAGQEETAVTAYLAGRKQTTAGFAMDSKETVRSSQVDAYLNNNAK